MFAAALNEVTARVLGHAGSRSYVYNGLNRTTLTVLAVRKALKQGYTFLDMPPERLIRAWDYIWHNSDWYEVMHQALYFYQGRRIEAFELQRIKRWVSRCTCWEHSDDLSKILAHVVEDNPAWMLPTLRQWNRAKSPWKRRQSVVSLIEYASKRRAVLPFDELIAFIDRLLADDEYYVQKGVGWTLREIYNVYPAQALDYLETNVTAISPLAYSAETEKLPQATKARLNAVRKASRPRASRKGQSRKAQSRKRKP